MSPEQTVKIAIQCILTITFIALFIVSFCTLLKGDTSLSFRKEYNAHFPSLTICPTFSDMESMEIENFDKVTNISIRDFLDITIQKFIKDNW